MSECVYLDDYTVSVLGRCTAVVWRVCLVDAQAVQFVFRVVGGIWATSVGDGRSHVSQPGYGGLVSDRAPAPPLWALLACIGEPGHLYAGVREELTTGSSRSLSRCPCARPRHRYLHNSCCIRGGVFLARFCRGARTCVRVFYPHGQSVI